MIDTDLSDIFAEYRNQYSKILENIYPSKNGTGFPERNLSVNFIRGYEAARAGKNENIFAWYEFQFGDNNNLHVDAVLINKTLGEMYIIESKRYNNPSDKIKEVANDMNRILELVKELKTENASEHVRIPLKGLRIYGVILADAWAETTKNREIIQHYLNRSFCEVDLHRYDIHPEYDTRRIVFEDYGIKDTEDYCLLSFLWEINSTFA